MAQFPPGHSGRPKGSKNRLTTQFRDDLLAAWNEHGIAALKVCAISEPVAFCKLVASTMPRDFHFETTKVTELADDALDRMIEMLRDRALSARQEEALELNPTPKVLLNGH